MSSYDRKQVRERTQRGKEGQAWVSAGLKPVRDPVEKCLPHLCLRPEPRRGQPWLSKFWEMLRIHQAWLEPAPDYSLSGLVKRPVPLELGQDTLTPSQPHRADVNRVWRRNLSSSLPSISSLFYFSFSSWKSLSLSPLNKRRALSIPRPEGTALLSESPGLMRQLDQEHGQARPRASDLPR